MFTQRRTRVFYFLKVLAHFRFKELVDFSTYDTQISCLTGATVKHVLRKKYIYTVPPHVPLFVYHK
jgi:hypothetical protein